MTTALVALAAALSVSAQEEAVVKREAGGPVLSIPDVFVTDQSGVRMKGVKKEALPMASVEFKEKPVGKEEFIKGPQVEYFGEKTPPMEKVAENRPKTLEISGDYGSYANYNAKALYGVQRKDLNYMFKISSAGWKGTTDGYGEGRMSGRGDFNYNFGPVATAGMSVEAKEKRFDFPQAYGNPQRDQRNTAINGSASAVLPVEKADLTLKARVNSSEYRVNDKLSEGSVDVKREIPGAYGGRLSVNLRVRNDSVYNLRGFGGVAYEMEAGRGRLSAGISYDDARWDPSVKYTGHLSQYGEYHAAVSTGVNYPEFQQLYEDGCTIVNYGLSREVTRIAASAGLKQSFGRQFTVETEAGVKRVDDYVEWDQASFLGSYGATMFYPINLAKVVLGNVKLGCAWQATDELKFELEYGFTATDVDVTYLPGNEGALSAAYAMGGWEAEAEMVAVSSRSFGGGELTGYALLNARVSRKVTDWFKVYVLAENLLNVRNEKWAYYQLPGRLAGAGAAVTF